MLQVKKPTVAILTEGRQRLWPTLSMEKLQTDSWRFRSTLPFEEVQRRLEGLAEVEVVKNPANKKPPAVKTCRCCKQVISSH